MNLCFDQNKIRIWTLFTQRNKRHIASSAIAMFAIVKNFGSSFIKDGVICMNLPFIYKTGIENCYIKIHHLCFKDFNILFKTLCHRKIDFSRPRLF